MDAIADELRHLEESVDWVCAEIDRLHTQRDALLYELETLCQAIEGHRGGALTHDGLWHYVVKARAVAAKIEGR